MVPDIVPPPPPPPMPSANFVPPKPALAIVKSEKSCSPPRNPVATSDSFDNVINEIKIKGGTLRKTKRKEVIPLEECVVPQINLKSVETIAKPTFKNEIVVNIVPSTTIINIGKIRSTDVTDSTAKVNSPDLNGTAFKLRRPSDFLNGTKPELVPAKKEVPKPQLAPKVHVNGIKSIPNGTATNKIQKPPPATSKVSVTLTSQPPQRRPSLVSATIQRLTSVEPESPTDPPFKRNQPLTRSTSGGISSTIQKLERQQSQTETVTPASFQRSNSVRQRINQMNQVEKPKHALKDGTQTVGRRPMVPRPSLPRPSNGTMKFLNELNNPSIAQSSQNGNMRLENEEARVGTTVNVADMNGTVTASDPTVKKLVYGTYRNFLGAYNNKANHVVTNQTDIMVVQDKGVTEQLAKITQNGKLNNITGRAIQKPDE